MELSSGAPFSARSKYLSRVRPAHHLRDVIGLKNLVVSGVGVGVKEASKFLEDTGRAIGFSRLREVVKVLTVYILRPDPS